MTDHQSSARKWLVTSAIVAGAAVGGYSVASAASSTTNGTASTTAPASGTTQPSTGTFHSNEDPAHEKAESPQREADENAGRAGFGHGGHGGPGDHGGQKETVVTGATADKIKAAALAAVPGTLIKAEQRADGTYEAEITKTDGTEVHVSLDKSFKVTDTGANHHGFGRGGHGFHHGSDATPGANA